MWCSSTSPIRVHRRNAVKEVLATTGGTLDAVVHNAGVSGGGAFEELSDAEIRWVFETNFFGVLALTRSVLPVMRAQRSGRERGDLECISVPGYAGPVALLRVEIRERKGGPSPSRWSCGCSVSMCCASSPAPTGPTISAPSPRTTPDDSPYAPMAEPFERFLEEAAAEGADPQEVAEVVARALEAHRPRIRYPVGPEAKMEQRRGDRPAAGVRSRTRRIVGIEDNV